MKRIKATVEILTEAFPDLDVEHYLTHKEEINRDLRELILSELSDAERVTVTSELIDE